MKKFLAVSLLFITPAVLFAETISVTSVSAVPAGTTASSVKLFSGTLQKGQQSTDVEELQNILKEDPSIYPEGLVTGYYGTLTEAAVKRLQARYNIPQTGVVDEPTQSVIYPQNIQITVLAPNGGENWGRTESHTIMWQTNIKPFIYQGRELLPETTNTAPEEGISIRPFYHRASIDLIKDSSPNYQYHIGTVDLYQSQYTWKIPSRVASGSDYRIRISVGGHVPCYQYDVRRPIDNGIACPMMYPIYSTSDTSDNVFSITGDTPPSPEIIAKLKSQVTQIEQTLQTLLRQVQALKSTLWTL